MAPGVSVGWMREIVPFTAVACVTMNDCPPSDSAAPRMKSACPPEPEM
jgi:hypothetical protein